MLEFVAKKISTWAQELLQHRGSLTISFLVTLFSLAVYFATFVGERPMPVFNFIDRLELDTLDARFQIRGPVRPDPRIIIVDIDQRSQEVLGHWPFPRFYFAELLDALRGDGARVAAFDITFSQPDETPRPLRTLVDQLMGQKKQGKPLDPALLAQIQALQKKYDYDQRFAEAIERFGNVVLGDYFLYTQADLEGVSKESLDRYANLIEYFPFPQVNASNTTTGLKDRIKLIGQFADADLAPQGAEANTELFTDAIVSGKGAAGFFNVKGDPDGVVRRVILALPFGRDPDPANWDFYASTDVQALRLFLGLSSEDTILNFNDSGVVDVEFGSKIKLHTDPISRLMVNFRGPERTYPYVSFADAALGKFAAGTFKDKLVLVGASATGIGDLRVTPYSSLTFPGVEIHANALDNALNGQFLRRGASEVLIDALFMVVCGIGLGFWLALVPPRWMFLTLLCLVPFAVFVYFAFLDGRWLNFIMPSAFTLIPNVGFVALYRVLIEDREKRRVRGAFQQYVSPEVVRRLLSDPQLVQPRKTEVTVLFSDIRGFTTISESLDAEELADLLNEYLTEMTRLIFMYQGTLDKYIGDAVMAIWGAPFDEPRHAEPCCLAALSMFDRLTELREEWQKRGRPPLDIGIGINTGVASVGNMGSKLRYGYTALGDNVNLASRLEGLNKEYGTHIIISEFTYRALTTGFFLTRELDLIRVKGKSRPVVIYELLSNQAAQNDGQELVELFSKGREAYKQRDWLAASEAFEQVLGRWPDDGPSRLFLSRCREYLNEEPAENWDGVYTMKGK
jgi:adenylate cyclase